MIPPFYPRGFTEHPPPRDDRPYHLRSREELEAEAEWVRAAYLDEPAPNAEFPPLCSHEDEADERAATEAHEEWAADGYRTVPAERVWEPSDGPLPPIPDECYPADAVPLEPIELVPGGGVSTLSGAPGTHQDADGAVLT